MGRAVGSWVRQSKHTQEEDEDTGQDGQMSEVMKDRLLVNGGDLTDKSIKGRKEGQVLGGQTVGANSASGAERAGKRKGEEGYGDQMVRKCCGYIPHQHIQ